MDRCSSLIDCRVCAKTCFWTMTTSSTTKCFAERSAPNGEYLYLVFPGQDDFCPQQVPLQAESGIDFWIGVTIIDMWWV